MPTKQKWLYGCIIAFCILVAGIPWIWPLSQSDKHNQNCTAESYINALELAIPEKQNEAKNSPANTDKITNNFENKTKCSDLNAQWGMTDLGQKGYYAGLAGMILLFATLFETLRAGSELRRQTDISHMTSELELQPYLMTEHYNPTVGPTIKLTGSETYISGGFKLLNNGKIPAYITAVDIIDGEVFFDGFRGKANLIQTTKPATYQYVALKQPTWVSLAFKFDAPDGVDELVCDETYFDMAVKIEFEDAFSLKTKDKKLFRVRFVGHFSKKLVATEGDRKFYERYLSSIAIDSPIRETDVHESKRADYKPV